MTLINHHTKEATSFVGRDRRESLKAGALAGTVLVSIELLWLVAQTELLGVAAALSDWRQLGLQLAIAALTGGVFGIAYRYIRRADRNPHLDSGAVAAFAIARASGSLTAADTWLASLTDFALLVAESSLGFWLASLALNLALQRQWLQACPPQTEPHH